MDIRKVKKLIELLETSDIAEIEIKEGEEAVRISRSSSVMTTVVAPAAAPAAAPLGGPPPPPAAFLAFQNLSSRSFLALGLSWDGLGAVLGRLGRSLGGLGAL